MVFEFWGAVGKDKYFFSILSYGHFLPYLSYGYYACRLPGFAAGHYPYFLDQWSSVNPNGRKRYGFGFLKQLQGSPLAMKVPVIPAELSSTIITKGGLFKVIINHNLLCKLLSAERC